MERSTISTTKKARHLLLNNGEPVPGRPIQLIEQKNGKFQINHEALDIIRKLNGCIAVCSIVGPYRTGKSYILNLLLNKKNAFVLGSHVLSCTRGIWMWDTPIRHTNRHGTFNLILLDTEGLQSPDSTPELDNMIFVVSLLLSSLFVYNTKNVIDREAIRKLGVMTKLSKHIDSGSGDIDPNETHNPNDADVSDMQINLPDFIWAVRDYFLESSFGSAKEYLDQALNLETGSNANTQYVEEANFIRQTIRDSFRALYCFLIPIPINNGIDGMNFDQTLRNLDKVEINMLRPDFLGQINDLCACIKDNIAFKSLLATPLSAPAFAKYVEEVVEQLNDNKQVKIVDSMMASIEYASTKSLQDALDMYDTQMNDFIQKNPLPVEWSLLENAHRNFYTKSLHILEQNLNGENEHTKPYLDKFSSEICVYEGDDLNQRITGGKFFLKRKENSEKIKNFFKDMLNSLWDKIMDHSRANRSENTGVEFSNAYNRLLQAYHAETRFSSSVEKSEAFNEWYREKDVDKVMDSMTELSAQIKATIQSEQRAKEEQVLKERAMQDKDDAIRQSQADKEASEASLKEIIARQETAITNLTNQINRPIRKRRRRGCTIL